MISGFIRAKLVWPTLAGLGVNYLATMMPETLM